MYATYDPDLLQRNYFLRWMASLLRRSRITNKAAMVIVKGQFCKVIAQLFTLSHSRRVSKMYKAILIACNISGMVK